MNCFRKILVAVEPSNVFAQAGDELSGPSQHALTRAIWLAGQTGAELTIFSTVVLSPFIEDLLREQLAEGSDAPTRAMYEILERCVAQAKEKGVQARSKVAAGIPWQEILSAGAIRRVRHRHCGNARLRTRRPDPFRIHGDEALAQLFGSRVDYVPGLRDDRFEILVPSDFSDASLNALRFALEIGRFGHACIHLLHVVDEPLSPPTWHGYVPPQMVEDYVASRRANVKKKLHDQLGQAGDRSAEVGVHVHVVEGQPDEAILQAIDDLNINLVVMGTAARSGVARVVLGNTTERLISHMRCSLIAVKSPEFESPLSLGSQTCAMPAAQSMSPARTF